MLVVNFNYTDTASQYLAEFPDESLINIHGELSNADNPIIFGYGDEMNQDFKSLEDYI